MKYLTLVIIALTARVYIVESECWIPMVCNGIPNWTKVETTCRKDKQVEEMKKLLKNDLDELTDQTTVSANKIKDLEKKLELLKSRKAANNPPKTTSEVETTAKRIGTSVLISDTTSVQETLEQAKQTTVRRSSPCIYKYNSTLCYWVEVKNPPGTNYANAVKICENQGSEIGQIYNNEIYEEVGKILRQRIPKGWSWSHAWIGLKIDTKTGEPTYPSSNAFTMWRPGQPTNDYGMTNVVLEVRSDENSASQGMWNDYPTVELHGVVCQASTG